MNSKINEEVLHVMSMFSGEISRIIKDNLLSVLLYGSTTLNDFTIGKGDIDFVVITKDNLSNDECEDLISFHDLMRNGIYGELAVQLEGAYFSYDMISQPYKSKGLGLYIGTNRKGWKKIERCILSKADLAIINRYGYIVYGEEVLDDIYTPSHIELKEEFLRMIDSNLKVADEIKSLGFSLHLIHTGIRGLYTYLFNDFISKGEASDWYCKWSSSSKWKELITEVSNLRHPISKNELDYINKDYIMNNAPSFLRDIKEYLG